MVLRLEDIYVRVCNALGWQPRELLMHVLRELDGIVRSDRNRAVLVRAPTGYGKSTLSLTLYVAIKQFGRTDLGFRVIHSLPMRSIGDKMERDMREKIEILVKRGFDRLSPNDLGLQHMGSPGSPYLAKRFVITTGDTLISSLYKAPPTEIRKIFLHNISHYEIPRGFIYSSAVVFDEFHLYPRAYHWSMEGGGDKALTSMLAAINAILDSGSPVVIATATLPDPVIEILRSFQGLKTRLSEIPRSIGYRVESRIESVSREVGVRLVRAGDLDTMINDMAGKAIDLSSRGSVLVILNTVDSAVKVYTRVKHLLESRGSRGSVDAMLIHGRMVERDRKKIIERLSIPSTEGEKLSSRDQPVGRILVSTQVLEAGVDVSFNYLLTEVAPPESLIQRLGRVARYGGYGEAYIYIAENAEERLDPIYPREILRAVSVELDAMARTAGGFSHRELEDLLKIYNRAVGGVKGTDVIKRDFEKALKAIDEGIDIYSSKVKTILRDICSFLRDSDLVRLLPVELEEVSSCLEKGRSTIELKVELKDTSIPVDSSVLKRLFRNNRIVGIYTEDGRCIDIDSNSALRGIVEKISGSECPSIEMIETHHKDYPVAGLIVKGYDEELGLVL